MTTPSTTPPTTPPTTPSFDTVLGRIAGVDGWLSEDQARALYGAATRCRADGRIVEIGSFRGRSTIVLASAAPMGVEIVAIDPHAGNDRGPQELEGFESEADDDHRAFTEILRATGVAGRVRHLRKYSADAHGEVSGPISVLFVDGAHRYQPARADLRDWGARVEPGGMLLIHDSFSSVGVTLAILRTLVLSGDFRYLGRARSLAMYTAVPLAVHERARNAVRQLVQLPWFARNVVIKALILLRLGGLTRLLGHREASWPY